jgi:hypothetical protein
MSSSAFIGGCHVRSVDTRVRLTVGSQRCEEENPAAAALGRPGGKARTKKLSLEKLSKVGLEGAAARWKER